ncbi:hypothetical protein G6F66_014609 [Rhizopus arrhizus]|nr:hypothetical protein G6F66_014609 [Rhizopus arrhizus]
MFNSHHPTSKGVSFFTRLNDKVISPLRFIYGARHAINKINQEKKAIGLKVTMNPMDVWKDSIKIVNNAFGFEAPRPVGPLRASDIFRSSPQGGLCRLWSNGYSKQKRYQDDLDSNA